MFLYKKIKNARIENKMTQKQLASELTTMGRKTSNTAIANWESGLNSPDVDTLQLICKILNKDANYFFGKTEDLENNIDLSLLTEEELKEVKEYIDYLISKRKK